MNINEKEDMLLAPYAAKSRNSKGRLHRNEKEHEYRSPYQRDRDRIIHSVAFRRLEYKTQVFVNHEGDDYRTRLTHSIEVAQIARTLAKALSLCEELTEAVALAHDLGHTPFGHAGEDILNDLMQGHGGFEHNIHTLKIVDLLEERYPDFPGLNLTWETREGIVKHTTQYDKAKIPPELEPNLMPTLEAQIVDIADEIAYDNHDLDDGLASGLIREEMLDSIPLWQKTKNEIERAHPGIGNPVKRYQIIRKLISLLVDDAYHETLKRLNTNNIKTLEDVRNFKTSLIDFSESLKDERAPLRKFLQKELYQHFRVNRMSDKAKRFIEDLFRIYIKNTSILPEEYQNKITDEETKYVVICDYIAGMTDRFALNEHEKLFDPYKKV
ncbi:MAG: deoxyguanosinetriphosphate triphosphohydrolase [Candidatus Omnitrophica bacterium CG1_02_44_16]|nr:MAG: deoxyguanosinetriphosphate triphosphohydrolase [Candidatus Omnitrophica bacterium CG1_02_44_16]PIY83290.1 MAG: deoxyguanosinetriphosphate triphosphohydrolase [Candidatus Omnitrophica bacterium CG_4_10_14_0_8_um_filter_44_12]PIZ84517.1 MAG: deoxyguanosinetriphosphate triphosphohydrolase [Candidatus Omnitrophica bacterium CG_4_10_14_0_2_um_filter_44_9]